MAEQQAARCRPAGRKYRRAVVISWPFGRLPAAGPAPGWPDKQPGQISHPGASGHAAAQRLGSSAPRQMRGRCCRLQRRGPALSPPQPGMLAALIVDKLIDAHHYQQVKLASRRAGRRSVRGMNRALARNRNPVADRALPSEDMVPATYGAHPFYPHYFVGWRRAGSPLRCTAFRRRRWLTPVAREKALSNARLRRS